ncbi:MAG: RNA polymerase sigma-70 factor [Bacteroidia bacterium]
MNLLRTPVSSDSSPAYLYRSEKDLDRMETEQEWIAAIRKGDEQAFERMFRAYHAALCRHAVRLLEDAEDAEEAVQQVFLKIWERREAFEITVALKAYLYRAVHNAGLNMIERKKRERNHQQAELHVVHRSEDAVPEMRRKELEVAIQQAIQTLPEQCRGVFELSRFEELKYREIADTLGISIKTVENQMGKALRLLRERLSPFLSVFGVLTIHELLNLFFQS